MKSPSSPRLLIKRDRIWTYFDETATDILVQLITWKMAVTMSIVTAIFQVVSFTRMSSILGFIGTKNDGDGSDN